MKLTRVLVRLLRRAIDNPRHIYYALAGIAGIVFGVVASAAVGLFFPLTLALVPGVPGFAIHDRILLTLIGPILMVPGALYIALSDYAVELVGFGIAFGLLNGWMVRKAAAALVDPPSDEAMQLTRRQSLTYSRW